VFSAYRPSLPAHRACRPVAPKPHVVSGRCSAPSRRTHDAPPLLAQTPERELHRSRRTRPRHARLEMRPNPRASPTPPPCRLAHPPAAAFHAQGRTPGVSFARPARLGRGPSRLGM